MYYINDIKIHQYSIQMSTVAFSLDDIYHIMRNSPPFVFQPSFYNLVDQIDSQVKPIFVEKQDRRQEHHRSKRVVNHHKNDDNENWEQIRNSFKTTNIEKSTEGVDKWIQDIRLCINKMSTKNYDNQRDKIMELLEKCLEDEETKEENFKKIAGFVFSVASTNRFFVELYASLYKELMEKYEIFQTQLQEYLNSYVNGIKTMKYVDPNVNYEEYCMYNKQNDMRKANAIFIVHLVKHGALPIMRALNIISSFQELSNEYMAESGRVNEVEEIAEVMYIFLKDGKDVFNECKGEWIWKFVIIPHVEKISKMKKGDKPSLSQRAIFKYMDITG
jgi:hypothetical protein